ncbi:MAG: hypothetical protein HY327_09300 [Chloroflexi bacterium]|nr:hypothetical protein [Chloroflexota bacterium]
MKSQTDAEQFCIFPPPHGQIKKFLGVIKVNAEQRLAVGLCPIDWATSELEPLFKGKGYEWFARPSIVSQFPKPYPEWLLRRFGTDPLHEVGDKIHPPNTLLYCEYHGGTQQGIAAGDWCILCEAVRKWALGIIDHWVRHSSEKRARALQGGRHMKDGEIISPDALDWGVAIEALRMFPDQQSRKIVQEQLDTMPPEILERIENSITGLFRSADGNKRQTDFG